ncbi:MAG TPA: DUF2911 domain-containing protein [Panacibacter sp.]|nr:DUF2911 domain-containing protein [Panacibacter sp.]
MKRFFPALLCLLSFSVFAQQKPTDLDKSPMDMSYEPANYPILKMNGKAGDQPIARVIYGRPQKTGRQIFGGIVNYNQVWRMGANEATEIEFFKNVKIDGKTVAKGRYSMYAICNENKWTIILNTEKDIWGLSYNQKKDILRTDVPVKNTDSPVEAFTIYFDEVKGGANMNILWDSVRVALPISF